MKINGHPRRRRIAFATLVVLVAAGILLYSFRVSILTGLANVWCVDDHPVQADAIVILGGGIANRSAAAIKLFHEGYASNILFMNVRADDATQHGITLPEREITRRLLLSNNIPESSIEAIGADVASTRDETKAVHAWITNHNAHSILIVTDLFHTRRVNWIFRKELKHTDVKIHVCVAPTPDYGVSNWWRREQGFMAFQNECMKIVYYWLKY